MKAIKSVLFISALAIGSAAFAAPSSDVGGNFQSNTRVKKVDLDNRATLGYAKQELNVGSVKNSKVGGNARLNVQAEDIVMRNRATLGYAEQEVNLGSIK